MNILKCFFILIFLPILSYSQPAFQKEYVSGLYNQLFSLSATADSGFILAGMRKVGMNEIYVVKTAVNGDTLWTRSFVDTSGYMIAFEAFETEDGGFLIGGRNILGGTENFLIIRTDNDGNILWTKSYDGNGNDDLMSMIQTADSGFLLTGYTQDVSTGHSDIFLVKIDSTGGLQWSKTYGNVQSDYGEYAIQAPDGSYFITGAYTYPVIPINPDVLLMKTDSVGNLIWAKTYAGSETDFAEHLMFTNDGGLLITGRTYSFGAGNVDFYIIKTDINGNLQWANAFGWVRSDTGWEAQEDNLGYLISGILQDTINLQNNYIVTIHIDQQGNLDWVRAFDDSTFSNVYIAACADGGFGLGFSPTSNGSTSGTSFSLIKTDSQLSFSCSQILQITGTITQPVVQVPAMTTGLSGSSYTIPLFTSNGATINTLCPGSGLEENNLLESISIYPNPSSGQLHFVNFPPGKKVSATIFDNTARAVIVDFIIYNDEVIDISQLVSGYYFIRLEVDEFVSTRKVALIK